MAQADLTLTVDTRMAQVVLTILKPLCWLRLIPTNLAASIVVHFVRFKTN